MRMWTSGRCVAKDASGDDRQATKRRHAARWLIFVIKRVGWRDGAEAFASRSIRDERIGG